MPMTLEAAYAAMLALSSTGPASVELLASKAWLAPPTMAQGSAPGAVLEGRGIEEEQPLGQSVEIDFARKRLGHGCAMGMVGSVLVVE